VPHVKIISATMQDWISGAPGGRSGTTYTIKVGILANKPVVFKNMWLGKQQVAFDMQTFFKDPNKKPARGDSILLVYVKTQSPQTEVPKSQVLPTAYEGDALVEYMTEGQLRYFTVKKFLKLEMVKGQ
jgi:hypothetical protein